MLTIRIYVDKRGEHRWRLKAANGKVIADSGEGYKRRTGAERAAYRLVELLKGGAQVTVSG